MNIVDFLINNSKYYPLHEAVVYKGRVYNWREVFDEVELRVNLLNKSGFKQGDRLAVLFLNSDEWLYMYFAVNWLGGIYVPLNYKWSKSEIIDSVEDCSPSLLLVDEENKDKVKDCRGVNIEIISDFLATDSNTSVLVPDVISVDDGISSIFYTGGTTGKAKGVMLTHANIVSHAYRIIIDEGLKNFSKHSHIAPLYHIADAQFIAIITILRGSHLFIPNFSELSTYVDDGYLNGSQTILVPTMISSLLDRDEGVRILSVFERVFYGASPMNDSLLKFLIKRFSSTKFVQLYGQTEASPTLTILNSELHKVGNLDKGFMKSAGRPLIGTKINIIDGEGNKCEINKPGQIVAQGGQIFNGYWNNKIQTDEALCNGWLYTGDVGYEDEDGFIHVTDRIKDMIISGGENIYSVEVENVIFKLGGVKECAAVGIPDEKWGERVCVVIFLKENEEISKREVQAHCISYLPSFKCPKDIIFTSAELPKSGAGKILKNQIRNFSVDYLNSQNIN
jgi:long-chain acyl-CoA synthetase